MPHNPELEKLLPQYLHGNVLQIAQDFVVFMRANTMSPAYQPSLRFKCNCKGKTICTISLPRAFPNPNPYRDNEFAQAWMNEENRTNQWVVIPQLDHLCEYEDLIDDEMKETLWDEKNMYTCNGCWKSNANFPQPRDMCGPRPVRTLLGREFQGLCNRGFFWFFTPDEVTITYIKKLLEWEQQARGSNQQTK